MTFAHTIGLGIALAASHATLAAIPELTTFEGVDLNSDGYVIRSETDAVPWLAEHFAWADRNGNGMLSRAEFERAMQRRAEVLGAPEPSYATRDDRVNAVPGKPPRKEDGPFFNRRRVE